MNKSYWQVWQKPEIVTLLWRHNDINRSFLCIWGKEMQEKMLTSAKNGVIWLQFDKETQEL